MVRHSIDTASFFSVLYCCAHFLALWRGLLRPRAPAVWRQGNTSLGTGALQNNTTGDSQYRQRIRCAL